MCFKLYHFAVDDSPWLLFKDSNVDSFLMNIFGIRMSKKYLLILIYCTEDVVKTGKLQKRLF